MKRLSRLTPFCIPSFSPLLPLTVRVVSCYASVPCASHRLAQLLFAPMHAVSATGVANSISPIDFSWDAHVAASAAVAPIHWYPAMLRRISRAVLGNVCGDERAFVKAA